MNENAEQVYRMCLRRLIVGGPASIVSCCNADGAIPNIYLEMMVYEGDAEVVVDATGKPVYKAVEKAGM
jgi:hypothetical protein